MNALLVLPVVQHHIKTARHGNDELLQPLMRVATTFRTPWHVIQIVDTLNIKGDMVSPPSIKVKFPRGSEIFGSSTILQRSIVIVKIYSSTNRTCLAGLPTTKLFGATSLVTTEPAATKLPEPMVSPGKMTAPAPMEAPFSIVVCKNFSGYLLLLGKRSFVKVALGPIKTSSPTRRPSHSWTPLLTVTRSPITTSFSIKTWEQTLHSAPIFAPASTTTNCQILVPSPIESVATSASS